MGAILPIIMALAPVVLPEIAKWFNKPGNTDWLGGLFGGALGSADSGGDIAKQLKRIADALEASLPKGTSQPVG
jgi:hypothetical protein